MRRTFAGRPAPTTKRTTISLRSPGCSRCRTKQKHSVLLKKIDAFEGATLGMACPVIG